MRKILVGTASWTDPGLIKSKLFYPPEAKSPEERLRYYASQFPIVEVDSSYYAMPSSSNAEKWAERTPDDFVFNIKAFRLLTGHQTPQASLPKDIQGELALHFVEKKNVYYKDRPAEIRDEMWRRYRSRSQRSPPLRHPWPCRATPAASSRIALASMPRSIRKRLQRMNPGGWPPVIGDSRLPFFLVFLFIELKMIPIRGYTRGSSMKP